HGFSQRTSSWEPTRSMSRKNDGGSGKRPRRPEAVDLIVRSGSLRCQRIPGAVRAAQGPSPGFPPRLQWGRGPHDPERRQRRMAASLERTVARDAALAGGEVVARYFREGIAMRNKAVSNLVSDADIEAEH